ncbi:unnamed protein product [Victoria cruziana]
MGCDSASKSCMKRDEVDTHVQKERNRPF